MTTVFLNQIWPKADHSPVGFFLRASFSFYKRSLAQGSQVLGEDRVENDVEFGPSVTLDRERIMNSCPPVSTGTHIKQKHGQACNPRCLEGRSRRITSSRPAWATLWIQGHNGQESQCLKILKHKTQVKDYRSAVRYLCNMQVLGSVAVGLRSV